MSQISMKQMRKELNELKKEKADLEKRVTEAWQDSDRQFAYAKNAEELSRHFQNLIVLQQEELKERTEYLRTIRRQNEPVQMNEPPF